MEASDVKKFQLETPLKAALLALTIGGGALTILGFVTDSERMWHSYLVSYFFFSCLALGGLFFAAIQHLTAAGWSVTVRRMSEALTAFLPFVLIAGIPLALLAGKDLYMWMDHDLVAGDKILKGKAGYLNTTFFAIRFVLFALGWCFFAMKLVGFSLKQDEDGDPKWTVKSVSWSVGFLAFFAISYSLFSVDFLMSLEPHWFSTIFGIYCFAGLFQSTFALLILMSLHVMNRGWAGKWITIEHVHDLAKFMKGFTVFWAYIAFSQFMLIWYANLPEETIFYLHRAHGGWLAVTVGLFVFRFVVPFLALLPRWAKRTPSHLVPVCILVLVMQYVDLYWLVYPNFDHDHVAFNWMELSSFAAFAGIFGLLVAKALTKVNLIPVKDPRKDEALHHHVTY